MKTSRIPTIPPAKESRSCPSRRRASRPRNIRPLLADPNTEVAAAAGYLLAVLGEPDGLPPLVRYWRENGEKQSELDRLVYQAIAVIDDPKYIGVLREIYDGLQQYDVGEFYWTIRIMSGPEILKFRKEVRDHMDTSNTFIREQVFE